MKPATPKTELPASTQLPKVVCGGFLHKISLPVVATLTAVFVFAFSPVLRAQSAPLQPVKPDAIPLSGTFWSLQLGNHYAPLPFLPSYLGDVKVYYLGQGNSYLYDDLDFDYKSYRAKQAEIMAEADALKWLAGAGGNPPVTFSFTTNDLWLEMIEMTNTIAHLVIHRPWNQPNGVYDLYFRTNLNLNPTSTFSLQWSRVERTTPGQTNLAVTNLLSDQGFFILGPRTNAIRPGFDQQFLERNDDNYCCGVDGDDLGGGTLLTNLLATLPFAINFFGSTNTSLYVNNNGNVTFDGQNSAYLPGDLASLGKKIIAPYWADVDTRNTNSDVVRFGTNVVDGHLAFGVGWVNVGYFRMNADRLLSCQLVIIDRSDLATNDFDMEFNYDRVEWEWGEASIGDPPRAGYSDCLLYTSPSPRD